jgi:hypothetical protein
MGDTIQQPAKMRFFVISTNNNGTGGFHGFSKKSL